MPARREVMREPATIRSWMSHFHAREGAHLNRWREMPGTQPCTLQSRGVRIPAGTIVDATIIHAPSSETSNVRLRLRLETISDPA